MSKKIVVKPRVIVKTPSTIHLGILDIRGDLGRFYGSLGIAVREPETIIEVSRSNALKIEGENKSRAQELAKLFIKSKKLTHNFEIKIIKSAPQNVGLGSDTQLALAIGKAICRLSGLYLPIEEIPKIMGIEKISGIGTYAFKLGGFIIDGGRRLEQEEIPPLILRENFPESWFFVIGIPNVKRRMEEIEEETVMIKVREDHKDSYVGNASRIVLMKLLPALIERDLQEFGEAVSLLHTEMNRILSVVHGGIANDPVIEEGLNFLLRNGASGASQTFFGPAFFGMVGGEKEARGLTSSLTHFLGKRSGGKVICTNVNNNGAFARFRIV